MKPLAIKKDIPISQITLSPKPESALVIDFPASPGATTCVSAVKPTAIIHIVPIGAAFRMIPKIVAANIAKRCHAFSLTPSGTGINQMMSATAKVIATFLMFISFMIIGFNVLESALNLNYKEIIVVLICIFYLIFIAVKLHSQLDSCTVIFKKFKAKHRGNGLSRI